MVNAESFFPEQTLEKLPAGYGVLPSQSIRGLLNRGHIESKLELEANQIQPASLDLRLDNVGYEVRASFLPGRHSTVLDMARALEVDRLDLEKGAVLRRGSVYVLELQESLNRLPYLAKANPKSTTGRLDLMTRLITDGAFYSDRVERGYSGPLYVEVAPMTFNVRVRAGAKLNQLRFFQGISAALDKSRAAAREGEPLVYDEFGEPMHATVRDGLWFSVDLKGRTGEGLVGWKAIPYAPVIDIERTNHYDPEEFWERVSPREDQQMILQPGEFYILGSRERVSVPPDFAAEMFPYDPSMGEFRVHYAGFFDPGFGYEAAGVRGTRAILEVRSYEIPYLLRDGQSIGRMIYQPLVERPETLYGQVAGSSYQHQTLGLAKQFKAMK